VNQAKTMAVVVDMEWEAMGKMVRPKGGMEARME
jgi:hypothetical protein